MISKEDIKLIQDTAKIEEVINDFVSLKKRGVNYIGLCPFHNEKTPSFTVSPAKNIYKCFGCGAAGSSVNFLMEHEHYTYPEALRYLANKYSIEISEEYSETEEEKEQANEEQLLFLIHELAQKYYVKQLNESEDGKLVAIPYLRKRSFSDAAINKFGIGYAPNDLNGFVAYAISQGYKHEDLKKAGLAVDSSNPIDRFKGRITFPIYSISGRVLGFGGRLMTQSDKSPKYLNSPETLIYIKSKVLYGLNFAKNTILKHDTCLLVEGYTDVIALWQAGVENVVASLGTSLTEEQIRLIQRYTPNITMIFDGDKAGIKASFRGIDMVLEAGMNVRVVMLPEGDDPDSFALKSAGKNLNDYFKNEAISFITFKTKILQEEADNDPIKKAQMIKDIVLSISLIPDSIMRTVYVKECSTILNIQEQVLLHEVSKLIRQRFFAKSGIPQAQAKEMSEETGIAHPKQTYTNEYEAAENLEHRIASLLLNFSNYEIKINMKDEDGENVVVSENAPKFIVNSLQEDEFTPSEDLPQYIYNYFAENIDNEIFPDIDDFVSKISDDETRKYVIDLISTPYTLSINWKEKLGYDIQTPENAPLLLKKEIEETILLYKLRRLEKEKNTLNDTLKETQDIDEQNEILVKMKIIETAMTILAKHLGITRLD